MADFQIYIIVPLIKRDPMQVFPCEYHKIFKNSLYMEHL